jgi:hypothetical protein
MLTSGEIERRASLGDRRKDLLPRFLRASEIAWLKKSAKRRNRREVEKQDGIRK